jgi:aryl-alcohol dehydrogenase-like predicted oxidoreductase
MTFGADWGWGADRDESRKQFDLYAEAGGNFIDTANLYTNGSSEKLVGEFVADERHKWVVATKYTFNNQSGEVNLSGNHRKNMVQSVNASLKRLNTDYIDLLWLHGWDFTTPVEEVMRSFDDLVRAGKILYVGVSDTPAWLVAKANTIAELRGWSPFIALQIEYSLRQRTPERDLIPMAQHFDIGVTAWSPLGGGALNWLRQQDSRFGSIIPIVGARTAKQLKDNLACIEFALPTEQMERLNEASKIELGFPHDMLQSDTVHKFALSGTLEKIDNHRA